MELIDLLKLLDLESRIGIIKYKPEKTNEVEINEDFIVGNIPYKLLHSQVIRICVPVPNNVLVVRIAEKERKNRK